MQVTIREVEEAWIEKARLEALRRKVSINQVLAEALRRGLGEDTEPVQRTNLEKFVRDSNFGPDWDEFLEKDLKLIDPSLWS